MGKFVISFLAKRREDDGLLKVILSYSSSDFGISSVSSFSSEDISISGPGETLQEKNRPSVDSKDLYIKRALRMSRKKVNDGVLDRMIKIEREEKLERATLAPYLRAQAIIDRVANVLENTSAEAIELLEEDREAYRERARKLRSRLSARGMETTPVDKYVALKRANVIARRIMEKPRAKIRSRKTPKKHMFVVVKPLPEDATDAALTKEAFRNARMDGKTKIIEVVPKERTGLPFVHTPGTEISAVAAHGSEEDPGTDNPFEVWQPPKAKCGFRVIPLPLYDGSIEYIDRNLFYVFKRCLDECSLQKTMLRLQRMHLRSVIDRNFKQEIRWIDMYYCLLQSFNLTLQTVCMKNFQIMLDMSPKVNNRLAETVDSQFHYTFKKEEQCVADVGVNTDFFRKMIKGMQSETLEGEQRLGKRFHWQHFQFVISLVDFIKTNTKLITALKELSAELRNEIATCERQLQDITPIATRLNFVIDELIVMKNRHDLQHRINLNETFMKKSQKTRLNLKERTTTLGKQAHLLRRKEIGRKRDNIQQDEKFRYILTQKNWLSHDNTFTKWYYPDIRLQLLKNAQSPKRHAQRIIQFRCCEGAESCQIGQRRIAEKIIQARIERRERERKRALQWHYVKKKHERCKNRLTKQTRQTLDREVEKLKKENKMIVEVPKVVQKLLPQTQDWQSDIKKRDKRRKASAAMLDAILKKKRLLKNHERKMRIKKIKAQRKQRQTRNAATGGLSDFIWDGTLALDKALRKADKSAENYFRSLVPKKRQDLPKAQDPSTFLYNLIKQRQRDTPESVLERRQKKLRKKMYKAAKKRTKEKKAAKKKSAWKIKGKKISIRDVGYLIVKKNLLRVKNWRKFWKIKLHWRREVDRKFRDKVWLATLLEIIQLENDLKDVEDQIATKALNIVTIQNSSFIAVHSDINTISSLQRQMRKLERKRHKIQTRIEKNKQKSSNYAYRVYRQMLKINNAALNIEEPESGTSRGLETSDTNIQSCLIEEEKQEQTGQQRSEVDKNNSKEDSENERQNNASVSESACIQPNFRTERITKSPKKYEIKSALHQMLSEVTLGDFEPNCFFLKFQEVFSTEVQVIHLLIDLRNKRIDKKTFITSFLSVCENDLAKERRVLNTIRAFNYSEIKGLRTIRKCKKSILKGIRTRVKNGIKHVGKDLRTGLQFGAKRLRKLRKNAKKQMVVTRTGLKKGMHDFSRSVKAFSSWKAPFCMRVNSVTNRFGENKKKQSKSGRQSFKFPSNVQCLMKKSRKAFKLIPKKINVSKNSLLYCKCTQGLKIKRCFTCSDKLKTDRKVKHVNRRKRDTEKQKPVLSSKENNAKISIRLKENALFLKLSKCKESGRRRCKKVMNTLGDKIEQVRNKATDSNVARRVEQLYERVQFLIKRKRKKRGDILNKEFVFEPILLTERKTVKDRNIQVVDESVLQIMPVGSTITEVNPETIINLEEKQPTNIQKKMTTKKKVRKKKKRKKNSDSDKSIDKATSKLSARIKTMKIKVQKQKEVVRERVRQLRTKAKDVLKKKRVIGKGLLTIKYYAQKLWKKERLGRAPEEISLSDLSLSETEIVETWHENQTETIVLPQIAHKQTDESKKCLNKYENRNIIEVHAEVHKVADMLSDKADYEHFCLSAEKECNNEICTVTEGSVKFSQDISRENRTGEQELPCSQLTHFKCMADTKGSKAFKKCDGEMHAAGNTVYSTQNMTQGNEQDAYLSCSDKSNVTVGSKKPVNCIDLSTDPTRGKGMSDTNIPSTIDINSKNNADSGFNMISDSSFSEILSETSTKENIATQKKKKRLTASTNLVTPLRNDEGNDEKPTLNYEAGTESKETRTQRKEHQITRHDTDELDATVFRIDSETKVTIKDQTLNWEQTVQAENNALKNEPQKPKKRVRFLNLPSLSSKESNLVENSLNFDTEYNISDNLEDDKGELPWTTSQSNTELKSNTPLRLNVKDNVVSKEMISDEEYERLPSDFSDTLDEQSSSVFDSDNEANRGSRLNISNKSSKTDDNQTSGSISSFDDTLDELDSDVLSDCSSLHGSGEKDLDTIKSILTSQDTVNRSLQNLQTGIFMKADAIYIDDKHKGPLKTEKCAQKTQSVEVFEARKTHEATLPIARSAHCVRELKNNDEEKKSTHTEFCSDEIEKTTAYSCKSNNELKDSKAEALKVNITNDNSFLRKKKGKEIDTYSCQHANADYERDLSHTTLITELNNGTLNESIDSAQSGKIKISTSKEKEKNMATKSNAEQNLASKDKNSTKYECAETSFHEITLTTSSGFLVNENEDNFLGHIAGDGDCMKQACSNSIHYYNKVDTNQTILTSDISEKSSHGRTENCVRSAISATNCNKERRLTTNGENSTKQECFENKTIKISKATNSSLVLEEKSLRESDKNGYANIVIVDASKQVKESGNIHKDQSKIKGTKKNRWSSKHQEIKKEMVSNQCRTNQLIKESLNVNEIENGENKENSKTHRATKYDGIKWTESSNTPNLPLNKTELKGETLNKSRKRRGKKHSNIEEIMCEKTENVKSNQTKTLNIMQDTNKMDHSCTKETNHNLASNKTEFKSDTLSKSRNRREKIHTNIGNKMCEKTDYTKSNETQNLRIMDDDNKMDHGCIKKTNQDSVYKDRIPKSKATKNRKWFSKSNKTKTFEQSNGKNASIPSLTNEKIKQLWPDFKIIQIGDALVFSKKEFSTSDATKGQALVHVDDKSKDKKKRKWLARQYTRFKKNKGVLSNNERNSDTEHAKEESVTTCETALEHCRREFPDCSITQLGKSFIIKTNPPEEEYVTKLKSETCMFESDVEDQPGSDVSSGEAYTSNYMKMLYRTAYNNDSDTSTSMLDSEEYRRMLPGYKVVRVGKALVITHEETPKSKSDKPKVVATINLKRHNVNKVSKHKMSKIEKRSKCNEKQTNTVERTNKRRWFSRRFKLRQNKDGDVKSPTVSSVETLQQHKTCKELGGKKEKKGHCRNNTATSLNKLEGGVDTVENTESKSVPNSICEDSSDPLEIYSEKLQNVDGTLEMHKNVQKQGNKIPQQVDILKVKRNLEETVDPNTSKTIVHVSANTGNNDSKVVKKRPGLASEEKQCENGTIRAENIPRNEDDGDRSGEQIPRNEEDSDLSDLTTFEVELHQKPVHRLERNCDLKKTKRVDRFDKVNCRKNMNAQLPGTGPNFKATCISAETDKRADELLSLDVQDNDSCILNSDAAVLNNKGNFSLENRQQTQLLSSTTVCDADYLNDNTTKRQEKLAFHNKRTVKTKQSENIKNKTKGQKENLDDVIDEILDDNMFLETRASVPVCKPVLFEKELADAILEIMDDVMKPSENSKVGEYLDNDEDVVNAKSRQIQTNNVVSTTGSFQTKSACDILTLSDQYSLIAGTTKITRTQRKAFYDKGAKSLQSHDSLESKIHYKKEDLNDVIDEIVDDNISPKSPPSITGHQTICFDKELSGAIFEIMNDDISPSKRSKMKTGVRNSLPNDAAETGSDIVRPKNTIVNMIDSAERKGQHDLAVDQTFVHGKNYSSSIKQTKRNQVYQESNYSSNTGEKRSSEVKGSAFHDKKDLLDAINDILNDDINILEKPDSKRKKVNKKDSYQTDSKEQFEKVEKRSKLHNNISRQAGFTDSYKSETPSQMKHASLGFQSTDDLSEESLNKTMADWDDKSEILFHGSCSVKTLDMVEKSKRIFDFSTKTSVLTRKENKELRNCLPKQDDDVDDIIEEILDDNPIFVARKTSTLKEHTLPVSRLVQNAKCIEKENNSQSKQKKSLAAQRISKNKQTDTASCFYHNTELDRDIIEIMGDFNKPARTKPKQRISKGETNVAEASLDSSKPVSLACDIYQNKELDDEILEILGEDSSRKWTADAGNDETSDWDKESISDKYKRQNSQLVVNMPPSGKIRKEIEDSDEKETCNNPKIHDVATKRRTAYPWYDAQVGQAQDDRKMSRDNNDHKSEQPKDNYHQDEKERSLTSVKQSNEFGPKKNRKSKNDQSDECQHKKDRKLKQEFCEDSRSNTAAVTVVEDDQLYETKDSTKDSGKQSNVKNRIKGLFSIFKKGNKDAGGIKRKKRSLDN